MVASFAPLILGVDGGGVVQRKVRYREPARINGTTVMGHEWPNHRSTATSALPVPHPKATHPLPSHLRHRKTGTAPVIGRVLDVYNFIYKT